MERKKKKKQIDRKATNNNNNIININLGKETSEYIKHTEKIKTIKQPKKEEVKEIKKPEIDDEIYSDELKEITNQYITIKNQASNQGITLPETLTVIPSEKLKLNNINDIITLTNYIKNLIKQIQDFIINYKQTQSTQTTQQTTPQQTGTPQTTGTPGTFQQAGKPFAYPQRYNFTQSQFSPYQYGFRPGVPPIPPVQPVKPSPAQPVKPTETPAQPATPAQPPPYSPETKPPAPGTPAPAQPTQPTQPPPPPYEPETKPPAYQPDKITASNLTKAENIKLYYQLPSNYPPMKNNNEFLNKINNDIMVLRNLSLNSINLVIKNKIYAIRSELLTIRKNYIDSIQQQQQTTTTTTPKEPINQDKINILNTRGQFLSNYLTTLNNANMDTMLLTIVDKQTRTRIDEIVNLVNRISNGENPDIENVMKKDLYADKGNINALNAFNSLQKARITELDINRLNNITLSNVPNTIRYKLTIDNNDYNQVFDANGNLMTIPEEKPTQPSAGDTIHNVNPNDTREDQLNKAVNANKEHCKDNPNKTFWISSAGPDGANFFQANECGRSGEEGLINAIGRWFEQYSVPFKPKPQVPTTDPSRDRGGGFVTRPIP